MSEPLWQLLALMGLGVAWVAFVFAFASLLGRIRELRRRKEEMEGALRPTDDPPPNPPVAKAVPLDCPQPTTFGIVHWGSTFEMRPDGWYVNGEPYNPDEDGVHQPSDAAASPRWEGSD